MPRVLFVSYVFPPMAAGGAVRTGQLARFLPENGWDVTVLTVVCSAAASIDRPALEALPAQVRVERAWGPNQLVSMRGSTEIRHGLAGWLRRRAIGAAKMLAVPDRQISWYPMAIHRGRRILAEEPHDAIFASYGPGTSALVGARLAAVSGLPFVLDFRDLWSDLPLDVFASAWHRNRAAHHEARCVRLASRVTCVSERMAEHLTEQHGLPCDHVVAIPNGFDPAQVGRPAAADRGGPFRLIYAGAIHRFQFVETFFEAVRAALDGGDFARRELEVVFVGNLASHIPARFGLADVVRCQPFVPHAQVAPLLADAHAMLLIEQPGYWGEYSYSAKTFDYAVTGKPVLALIEEHGNSARLLRELGTGIIVHPKATDAIRAALVRLVAGPRPDARTVDTMAPPLSRFDRRHLTGTLADVFRTVAAESPEFPS